MDHDSDYCRAKAEGDYDCGVYCPCQCHREDSQLQRKPDERTRWYFGYDGIEYPDTP